MTTALNDMLGNSSDSNDEDTAVYFEQDDKSDQDTSSSESEGDEDHDAQTTHYSEEIEKEYF